MSHRTQNSQILYKYFKAKIVMEKELDTIKSQLYQNPSFNPFQLFKQIDQLDRGKIGIQEILSFMVSNGLNATLQEIQAVLLYFTKQIFISMTTFIQALIPRTIVIKENYTGMCTPIESLTKLIISIIDHNDQLKTISKLTESMDQNNFDFNFGVLAQFTPQHLILLFNSFDDQLDGTSFQILFGTCKTIAWETVKECFSWKQKKRQPRLSEGLHNRKRQFQRLTSFNSAALSDVSTDQQSINNMSKIKFCTSIDVDIFDREAYLQN